jgi:hypothetical protein
MWISLVSLGLERLVPASPRRSMDQLAELKRGEEQLLADEGGERCI